jgi:hypothetical protein
MWWSSWNGLAAEAAMSDRDFVPILPNGENIDKNDKND